MDWRSENRNTFYHCSANLEERIRDHFLDGDHAILPCRITDYYDVIHKYSVEGFETLNPEFVSYISDTVRFIPAEYKLKLLISGAELSETQKTRIREALKEDAMYELGSVEEEKKALRKSVTLNIIGLVLMGTFLTVMNNIIIGMPREFLYIFFWFFAEVIISYILTDRRMIKNKHILAGRMVNMKVDFE
ncbi:MAG: hypothetical protein MJ059_07555 [Lachnospiraceae bacterium]|nr:hypothetical protein [Lachnospiraceae bacterium]